jgi:hypothetical protein
MSRLWSAVLIGITATAVAAQQPGKLPTPTKAIMIAAVSRDEYMLRGENFSRRWTREGTVAVEPLGQLTPSGKWSGLPCSSHTPDTADGPKNCLAFAHQYLSKPHFYTVISDDGNGADVHAAPTTLDECYGYIGTGTYSGAAIRRFAIATSSAKFFAESVPPHLLSQGESVALRKALNVLVPQRLDTTEKLRLFAVRLEGRGIFLIQRSYADIGDNPGQYELIFAIGTLDGGQFHLLHWKQNTGDEEERILGTIALKNGRQFLVTSVSDPEGQWFRVYGIRAGHLALIYTGGGSSC